MKSGQQGEVDNEKIKTEPFPKEVYYRLINAAIGEGSYLDIRENLDSAISDYPQENLFLLLKTMRANFECCNFGKAIACSNQLLENIKK